MSDSSELVSALRVVAEEISRFREEVQAIRRDIRGLVKAIGTNGQATKPEMGVPLEQNREAWLKEAAIRSSQKLFTG